MQDPKAVKYFQFNVLFNFVNESVESVRWNFDELFDETIY